MYKKIKLFGLILLTGVMLFTVSCKKGTFDINNSNPNVPSSADPKLVLTASLVNTASIVAGGIMDFGNYYMGYWAVSGDYIPVASTVQYTINTDFFAGNWDASYIALKNFQSLEDAYAGDPKGDNFAAISNIMKAFLYQRLVDIYNDIPYSEALKGGTNNFPVYDDAETVYKDLVTKLDAAVVTINGAPADAANPAEADVMFGGEMHSWVTFANTLKLKILMRLTESSGGSAYITSNLSGMTAADFIGADADAGVNPGYTNNVNIQQNPLWQDIGSTTTKGNATNTAYYRANSYAVNFYKNNDDPRLGLFYSPVVSALSGNDTIVGRPFGSTALEHNADISAIGGPGKGTELVDSGLLKSYDQPVELITSSQSFFLQAEAIQRGYLSGAGTAAAAYQKGVEESFRYLGITNYEAEAAIYTAQPGDNTNFVASTNPIKTIILQKWAADNSIDALESWSDWRRTGFPADLPVSIYPGTTAPHIPYRLRYPTSEYSYNAANVPPDGSINPITSKIFWMP